MGRKGERDNRIELLAPAGSPAILQAVVAAGADAVYFGGRRFGARAYADNFSDGEILDAIDYAHLYGRRAYVTVNTLLKNQEMAELYDYICPLYESGVDAVLVQDFGVLDFIRAEFPDLPLHASTQMTAAGPLDAKFLVEQGISRIVLPRELSLDEIRKIGEESGAEIEVFVHGALCYCYSGQCLLSSLYGGRSGNRGRCAQPCRLAYDNFYPLSMKDLCGIGDLDTLISAGVTSLKIEGRMKQLPYAAGVVSVYRRAIDEGAREGDIEELKLLGSRSGFTDRYYFARNGADMVTFEKPSYSCDENEQKRVEEKFSGGAAPISAKGWLKLVPGEAAEYTVMTVPVEETGSSAEYCDSSDAADGHENAVTVFGEIVSIAKSKPLDPTDVRARMEKTGGTDFSMEDVQVNIGENAFLPNGELNRLRREALAQLREKMLDKYRRNRNAVNCSNTVDNPAVAGESQPSPRIICLTENRKLLPVLAERDFVTHIILEISSYGDADLMQLLKEDITFCRNAGKKACVALPRVLREKSCARVMEILSVLTDLNLDGILVRNYGELELMREREINIPIVLDCNMYAYNDRAVRAFKNVGASRLTVPLELNRAEICRRDNLGSDMVIYGHYALMTSAQCIRKNTGVCDSVPSTIFLKDRKGASLPVKNFCPDCVNVIYNALPTILFTKYDELKRAGIDGFRLDFTVENEAETKEILNLFYDCAICGRAYPKKWENRYTGGHFGRGVE